MEQYRLYLELASHFGNEPIQREDENYSGNASQCRWAEALYRGETFQLIHFRFVLSEILCKKLWYIQLNNFFNHKMFMVST